MAVIYYIQGRLASYEEIQITIAVKKDEMNNILPAKYYFSKNHDNTPLHYRKPIAG
jgi:hypothetical protein